MLSVHSTRIVEVSYWHFDELTSTWIRASQKAKYSCTNEDYHSYFDAFCNGNYEVMIYPYMDEFIVGPELSVTALNSDVLSFLSCLMERVLTLDPKTGRSPYGAHSTSNDIFAITEECFRQGNGHTDNDFEFKRLATRIVTSRTTQKAFPTIPHVFSEVTTLYDLGAPSTIQLSAIAKTVSSAQMTWVCSHRHNVCELNLDRQVT